MSFSTVTCLHCGKATGSRRHRCVPEHGPDHDNPERATAASSAPRTRHNTLSHTVHAANGPFTSSSPANSPVNRRRGARTRGRQPVVDLAARLAAASLSDSPALFGIGPSSLPPPEPANTITGSASPSISAAPTVSVNTEADPAIPSPPSYGSLLRPEEPSSSARADLWICMRPLSEAQKVDYKACGIVPIDSVPTKEHPKTPHIGCIFCE